MGTEAAEGVDQRRRHHFRHSRFFQRKTHRHHRGDEDHAFPVYRLVGIGHVAETAGEHHRQRGDNHGHHGRNGVHHQRDNHRQHYHRRQRRLVVEGDLGRLRHGLSQHHPVAGFVAEGSDGLPRALHEQHVAFLDRQRAEVVGDETSVAAHTEYVDVETVAEIELRYCLLQYVRTRHRHNLGEADVVEPQVTARLLGVIGQHEAIVGHKAVDTLARSSHKKDVAGIDGRGGRGRFLSDMPYEAAPGLAHAQFKHIEAVVRAQCEISECEARYRRTFRHLHAPQVIVEAIFIYNLGKRAPLGGSTLSA